MSRLVPIDTMIMIDKEAQRILAKNKNVLDSDALTQAILGRMREESRTSLFTSLQQAQIGMTSYFRAQSRIRKRCEKQGDFFRPQMLVQIAPKSYSRLGPGGVLTITGLLKEEARKVAGAAKILQRNSAITTFWTPKIDALVAKPKATITKVMVQDFGYKWRPDDDQPFPITEQIILNDADEDDENA